MKILQIFGYVVAVHLLAFICIFSSPGCSSSPRNVPTPDATVPSAGAINYQAVPPEAVTPVESQPAFVSTTPGRATPTRPNSPNAAAIAPARTVANVASVVPYTIQKGDSLWSIAKKNGITVAELTKTNSLGNGAALHPGKKLMIPVKTPPAPAEGAVNLPTPAASPHAPAPAPAEAARPSGEVVRHVVASGDSLGIIARKYQVTVGDLAAANNITDPAKIRIGQQLVIPNGKGGKTAVKHLPKPAAPAPVSKPAPVATPPVEAPASSDVKPPPPGQDLDAGLRDSTTTEVPTIKVDDPAPAPTEAPKS